MPFYGNDCIQTWVITALDEHFELLDDAEKIEMINLFRDDEGWFDDDKWGKIVWDNYEDMLMEGINYDMLIAAIKHSFLNEEEDDYEFHSHMRGVFEEWLEENLTKKTEEDEIWADDDLALELNYGNCLNDGRHPNTTDDDWALFLEGFVEPIVYSEDRYRRLEKRLEERKKKETLAASKPDAAKKLTAPAAGEKAVANE